MSNALAIYQKIADPIAAAQAMALSYAAAASVPPEQGLAVALYCMAEGIDAYAYRRRYHTTPFGPAMRADAMRAEFRMNHGGKFKILEDTPEAVAIEFVDKDGEKFVSRVTWVEAQQEAWPWAKGKGPNAGSKNPADWEPIPANLKDNWAGPVGRAHMLMCRATSFGLRKFFPELVAGVYTPEEIADLELPPARQSTAPPSAATILSAQTAVVDASPTPERVVEAEFTPATPAAPATEAPAPPAACSETQRHEIERLFDELAFPADKREKALRKRGVAAVRSLTPAQANELIRNLQDVARLAATAKN